MHKMTNSFRYICSRDTFRYTCSQNWNLTWFVQGHTAPAFLKRGMLLYFHGSTGPTNDIQWVKAPVSGPLFQWRMVARDHVRRYMNTSRLPTGDHPTSLLKFTSRFIFFLRQNHQILLPQHRRNACRSWN